MVGFSRNADSMTLSVRDAAVLALAALAVASSVLLGACSSSNDEASENEVLIYTSAEDYRIAYMQERLSEEFPDYDITIEYMPTGNHAAKLITEGADTACDITYDLEYTYLAQLEEAGVLADLSDRCDFSIYAEDVVKSSFYLPEYRNGGGVIVNMDVLQSEGLEVPASYQDLLDPQYSDLISMPNPKSSGTGYMFYLSLVNAWGEETALNYFEQLTPNVLQYTESGSGPVNALLAGEVAIGLGMTGQAVTEINDGANFRVIYFEEGSPYSLYGQAIIAGHEDKQAVSDVFDFLYSTYGYESCQNFFPEKIFSNRTFEIENFPSDIKYADMSGDTSENKEDLLSRWAF